MQIGGKHVNPYLYRYGGRIVGDYMFLNDKKMSFKSPNPTTYDRYLVHIDTELKTESPALFGLHPNAEIDFRTTQSINLFDALEKLAPREQGSSGDDDEEDDAADGLEAPAV